MYHSIVASWLYGRASRLRRANEDERALQVLQKALHHARRGGAFAQTTTVFAIAESIAEVAVSLSRVDLAREALTQGLQRWDIEAAAHPAWAADPTLASWRQRAQSLLSEIERSSSG